jgi:adenylate cyclase
MLIEQERRRSEQLLLNVLPESIARRLRFSEQRIADGFAQASILFADVSGFTRLASQLTPEPLVRLLDGLFSRFDALVEAHGVEKIKTIGDAYMVASGIPIPAPDHARRLARFALALQEAVAQFNGSESQCLAMRVGINSGPVVAGVIGTKRFIYDIWGDTVNVASRMESHGIAGRIQVTESTFNLLKDTFEFDEPRSIEVKGVGVMRAYLLRDLPPG